VGETGAISSKEGNKEGNKMRARQAIPATLADWLEEIARAYVDAYETILCPLVGTQIDEPHLLHLAPAVCPRFRGIKVGKRILERTSNTKRTMFVRLP
jgi:hypothetical protein